MFATRVPALSHTRAMDDRRVARLRKPALGPEFEIGCSIRKGGELPHRRRVARVVAAELDDAALAVAVTVGVEEAVVEIFAGAVPPQRSSVEWSVRKAWTVKEDQLLADTVKLHGPGKWRTIAVQVPGRTNKQCRDRYLYHIDPKVSHAPFSPGEDLSILMSVHELGHKWSRVAARLPGRTDNAVKNRYNYFLQTGPLAKEVGKRTPMSCRRHWSLYESGTFSKEIDVPLASNGGDVEPFPFDEVLKTATEDPEEVKLICIEKYNEGADEEPVRKGLVTKVLGNLSVEGTHLSFRFPQLPPPPPPPKRKGKLHTPTPSTTPRPQHQGRSQHLDEAAVRRAWLLGQAKAVRVEAQAVGNAVDCSFWASMKEFYPEVKRRDEAEALVKSVFS